jgi:hypothetical protein
MWECGGVPYHDDHMEPVVEDGWIVWRILYRFSLLCRDDPALFDARRTDA